MPVYEYRAKEKEKSCDHCRQVFAVKRGMKEKPLRACPECGASVKRVYSSFSVGKDGLSPSRLKEHGFTKYVKRDKGTYENVTR